jgi:hypothetical protein
LFKKATNAITFANRAGKKVNEKIASHGGGGEEEALIPLSLIQEKPRVAKQFGGAGAIPKTGGSISGKSSVQQPVANTFGGGREEKKVTTPASRPATGIKKTASSTAAG